MKRGIFSSQSPTGSFFGAFACLSLLFLVTLLLGSCTAVPQAARVARDDLLAYAGLAQHHAGGTRHQLRQAGGQRC